MQRSGPLTRKTLPASWARKRDGTESRCFASSVCSKLPLKAKAHGVRESGESSRSEVAEWEEPRHPGPAVRTGSYPTLSHSATHLSSFVPHGLIAVRIRTCFPCKSAGLAGGGGGGGARPNPPKPPAG